MATPYFGFHDAEHGLEIRFYYTDNNGRATYNHLTTYHDFDYVEATELCTRLNDLIPLIGMLYVQNDPVFFLPDH